MKNDGGHRSWAQFFKTRPQYIQDEMEQILQLIQGASCPPPPPGKHQKILPNISRQYGDKENEWPTLQQQKKKKKDTSNNSGNSSSSGNNKSKQQKRQRKRKSSQSQVTKSPVGKKGNIRR